MPSCAPDHDHSRQARDHRLYVALLTLAVTVSLAGSAVAATYYVDNQSASCSNVGPGTETQPYCTIAAAVAARQSSGTTIIVKPGTYREQVTLPASGAAGSPIVIRAQSPGVVVDGAESFANAALWVQPAPALISENHMLQAVDVAWLAGGVTWSPQQVFVDGVRMTPSTAPPEYLPSNSFRWVLGKGLYLNVGGMNPGSRQILVGKRSYGFSMFAKSWVTIDGFEITRSDDRGINIQGGSNDLVIARNRVSFTGSYGIQSVGGTNVVIEENTVSDCALHGIGLTAGATGCTVRNNESMRNADPLIRRANGIYVFGAPANTFYGNRVHHNQDTGMHFASGASDCLAYNNLSWSNGDHGYDDLDAAATVHINDVAYGNFMDGFSFEGNAANSKLFNCIAVNNGLTTNRYNLWVNDLSSVGFVSDHNILWNSTAQPPIKYINTVYPTLAAYRTASGQDAHSRQADPKFVDAPVGNFMLAAGSPAIDAATSGVTNWPATDASGAVRFDDLSTANMGTGPVTYADIGALEYVNLQPDRAPVVTSPNRVRPSRGTTVTFTVTAVDPDSQAIQSLVMVPISMPSNSGAVFTVNATRTSGTFTWPLGTSTGIYLVRFVATNALSGSDTTVIDVRQHLVNEGLIASADGVGGELALSNSYPNPSRGDVEFALEVPQESQVRWAVFDLQGRMVWSENRTVGAGRTQLRWDGSTSSHDHAPTGVYLVRAWVDGTQFNRRIVRF